MDHNYTLSFPQVLAGSVAKESSKKRKRTGTSNDPRRCWDKRRAKTRINIGVAFPRWRELRDTLQLERDADLACVLLDSYQKTSPLCKRPGMPLQTPSTASSSDSPSDRVCGENPSQDKRIVRKRGRPRKSTNVSAVQTDESQSDSSQSSQDQQSTDEDGAMEVAEICFDLPPSCETDQSTQTEIKSEDGLQSEDDKLDLDVCKGSVAPVLDQDILPQTFTASTMTEEIKEEPVEAKLQVEERLDTSICSDATSEKSYHSFVKALNPPTVEIRAGPKERPLVAKKSHLTGLFSFCLQCGDPVLEYTTVSLGSLNRLQWKCLKGHLMWLFPNNNPA